MNNNLIKTISLLIIISFFSFTKGDDWKVQTFKVSKGSNLSVKISGGDIEIKTWDKDEVEVKYDGSSKETGIEQKENKISFNSSGYVDVKVTVPYEFNLNLSTAGGDIKVLNNIKGKVSIATAGGDISVKNVDGDLHVGTGGGDIKSGDIKNKVVISTGGGDISIGNVGGECKISTGGGNIKGSNIGSNFVVTTGGGDIMVENVKGSFKVTTGGGNVLGSGTGNGAKVTTGAGNINLKNLSGNAKIVTGSGNILTEFISISGDESKITSGNGNITIYIPENSKATIEAVVKFTEGRTWAFDKKDFSEIIQSDFAASTEDKRKGEYRAVYIINGGGTKIYLQASLGNIKVLKLKTN